MLSRPLDRSWLTPPLVAFLLGILLSPHGLGWLNPSAWGNVYTLLEETARLTLGISLMGIALRLPRSSYCCAACRSSRHYGPGCHR
ncbi:hypothetical protein KG088_11525 [Halomonas sp. TRM85114]|uniref:hypothetical protein n=1 Tax=Halomonas jincaotanensis TaxID=2810616 RepID=UPI001BD60455|nr:hypothetical protein [Halomonas jincaotanensis]MBS9404261.1 hypothetical protein [Halomonas jincaotanensis]